MLFTLYLHDAQKLSLADQSKFCGMRFIVIGYDNDSLFLNSTHLKKSGKTRRKALPENGVVRERFAKLRRNF